MDKNTNITLNLTLLSVESILRVLGQLPTSSNAYPLMMDVKKQTEEQITAVKANDSNKQEVQLSQNTETTPEGQPRVISQIFDPRVPQM